VTPKVYVHVGPHKTGTTFLQQVLWSQRDLARQQGVLLPLGSFFDHYLASLDIRGLSGRSRHPARPVGIWDRLVEEAVQWPGTTLVSHELFAAASAEQAERAIAAFGDTEVHVVVTAREPLGLFTASWQESLKNGSTTAMPDYARSVSKQSTAIWNWRTLDLRLVLRRWSRAVPAERLHVLVLDPTAPREDVWHRFAGVLGLDTGGIDLSGSFANTSMGVAEAETLRRVNGRLEGFDNAFDKGVFIRTFLADERLVPRRGERFWPEPDQVEECRRRGEEAIAFLHDTSIDVVGDVSHLRVPAELEPRRSTSSVTDEEVADVAVDLVATMLGDVRKLRREAAEAPPPAQRSRWRALARRALRRWRRG